LVNLPGVFEASGGGRLGPAGGRARRGWAGAGAGCP